MASHPAAVQELFVSKDGKAYDPGTIIGGRYRAERLIGEGGMGVVFEATHLQLGRRVALKMLHAVYANDANVVQRFQREAYAAGSIGHDNICEVTDIGTHDDGSLFLVMPLLKGFALSHLLSGVAVELLRVVDIVGQTLDALQAAHDNGIVHRDLKPENIFLTRLGGREDFVKLLDFGISKAMHRDAVDNLTRTGTVLGTPFYMAPEQAKGASETDHRVDLYAMGVILYELLTGKRPFEGNCYNEIMYRIIAEPFVPPRAHNQAIPPAMEKVIVKAMARDPAERYASAREMCAALQEAALDASASECVLERVQTVFSDVPAFTPTSFAANPLAPAGAATPQTRIDAPRAPLGDHTPQAVAYTLNIGAKPRWPIFAGAVALVIAILGALVYFKPTEQDQKAVVPLAAPRDNVLPAAVHPPAAPEQPVSAEPALAPISQEPDTDLLAGKPTVGENNKKPNTKVSKSSHKATLRENNEPSAVKPKGKRPIVGRFGTKIDATYED